MWRQGARGSSMAAFTVATVLVTAAALSGCESSEQHNPAETSGSSGKPKKPGAGKDMVAAVSASKTPGAVDLRFVLVGKPAVGQPVEIRTSLTPTAELELLFARFQASEGMELVKGAETQHYERPAVGEELSHTVTVIPKADGIYNITATVLTDSASDSIARTYTIPIIAGAGLPELPAAPATTASKPSRP